MVARRFAPAVRAAADRRAAELAAAVVQTEVNRAAALSFFRDNNLLPYDGIDGKDGINGKDGRDGYDGSAGLGGRDGVDGKPGLDGERGKDGANGRDGAPGPAGLRSERGATGPAGRDGVFAVETVILYESAHPLARASGAIKHMSDGTTRTLTVKRNSFGQPTALE
jgi:hypothetical protein